MGKSVPPAFSLSVEFGQELPETKDDSGLHLLKVSGDPSWTLAVLREHRGKLREAEVVLMPGLGEGRRWAAPVRGFDGQPPRDGR